MDIFVPIFIFFTIFVLCSLCGFCCKRKNEGAIFSTPVVVTSQTHQAVGGYPVQVQQNPGMQSYQTVVMPPQQNVSMQQGYPPQQGYPLVGGAPYPTGGMPYPTGGMPYPQAAPSQSQYPPQAGYPPQGYQAPYPAGPAAANMNPPTYNEVVAHGDNFQKQAPYNPNFSG